jgi:uncharacterized protein YndB with AHSA1/START domain
MTRPVFVYAIYINAPREAVFDALTDPAMTRDYWRHENASDWKVGSSWRHVPTEGSADHGGGKVITVDRPSKLVYSWGETADQDNPEKMGLVTFELTTQAGATRLVVIHEVVSEQELNDVSGGWPSVLSSLKSLLETGRSLGDLWGRGAA